MFVDALVNGIRNKDLDEIEKLKFVDMLRQLSRASLMVLAAMHKLYAKKVVSKGHEPPKPTPIRVDSVVEYLSDTYNPYLVESCINELRSIGLFSPNVAYVKTQDGKYMVVGSVGEAHFTYTDFSERFVNFIIFENNSKLKE